MERVLRGWLASLVIVALFSSISVFWFDKPTALFIHGIFGERPIPGLARSPALSIPLLSACIFVAFGLLAIMGRQFSTLEANIVLCDISTLAADSIKNQLKFAFGRTWPDSWAPHILSLVRDKVYGFHFFQSGESFGSFPSGHAAAVAAVMSVLWIVLPKLRPLYAICIGAVDIGLVVLNLHFVSDVVAGTFVGVSAGLFTVTIWFKMPADHRRWLPCTPR